MAKILIVDDEGPIVTQLTSLLTAVGHLVSPADSAARAMEILESEGEFSLLILDHHLGTGTKSGLQLLTELRSSDRHRTLPVIVCSGDSQAAAVKSFLTLQIAGFIVKPYLAGRFIAEIERVLVVNKARLASRPDYARPAAA